MAEIYVGYGEDPAEVTTRLLTEADVRSQIKQNARVVIKPNLVVSKKADCGATTHPEIVEAVIIYLKKECSVASIAIAEGSWVGANTTRAFAECGYNDIAFRHGVELIDTKRDRTVTISARGQDLQICRVFTQTDYFINVPVLKGHCQTDLTCCLKNLKGCIPDREKRRFHSAGLHRPIAALACALKPNLHIVDSVCGDLVFEEGGNPVEQNRVILGYDPVLLDSWCAGLIGFHPEDVDHLRLAKEWGVGRYADSDTEILQIGQNDRPAAPAPRSDIVRRLTEFTDEDGACSACFAALMFALSKTGGRSLWGEKIKIGQGFRGKSCGGLGVGDCASGCDSYVKGCPPKAVDIVDFIRRM